MKTEAPNRVLVYGGRRIPYTLRPSAGKRLRIIVKPDLSVIVQALEAHGDGKIHEAVQAKSRWIVRQLEAFESFLPLPVPHRFISGETMVYLGRQYRLKVVQADAAESKLRGRYLHVNVADTSDLEAVRSGVETWYRRRAKEVFGACIERCTAIAARHGAKQVEVTIRKMRTRWGSCASPDRIILNLHLVQVPLHCIDYVVMHELCHTVEHNHSKAFYRLLTRCMPDWKVRKSLLNQFIVAGV